MNDSEEATQAEEEAPEMIVDYEGECPSISGRSVLTFQAGHDPQTNEPKLRIVRNSRKGMFARDWASIALIDAILAKADSVTGRTFQDVHPGRSVNSQSFILGIVKDLGVVQPKDDNSRQHERVPGMTVLQALAARIAEGNTARIAEANAADTGSKTRRKAKAEE